MRARVQAKAVRGQRLAWLIDDSDDGHTVVAEADEDTEEGLACSRKEGEGEGSLAADGRAGTGGRLACSIGGQRWCSQGMGGPVRAEAVPPRGKEQSVAQRPGLAINSSLRIAAPRATQREARRRSRRLLE
jgi:hypothetical protein